MGISSSQTSSNMPISSDWKQINSMSSHRLYQHATLKEIGEEHMIVIDNTFKIDRELMIYNFRKNQKLNLVKVYGMQVSSNSTGCCGGTGFMRVLVEYLPMRLNDVKPYSFQQALYIFNEVISACNAIVTKLGPVLFEDTMFGVTQQGFVKVWINSEFELNRPSQVHQLKRQSKQNEREMVMSLIRVVESHIVGGKFPKEFIEPIQSFLGLNFISFQSYIEGYADNNRVIIPDRLAMKVVGQQQIVNHMIEQNEIMLVQQVLPFRNPQGVVISSHLQNLNQPPIFPYHSEQNVRASQQFAPIMTSQKVVFPQTIVRTESFQQPHQMATHINPQSSLIFPRYETMRVSPITASSQLSKKPLQVGSILTADRTLSHFDNRNSASYHNSQFSPLINHSIINPISTTLHQPPLQMSQKYEHINHNQINSFSDIIYPPKQLFATQLIQVRQPLPPAIDLPPSQFNTTPLQSIPPRISLPASLSIPPQFSRISPLSLPVIQQEVIEQQIPSHTTPIKQIERQIQKQQDMYMTTTTYKNHPKITFQYRTIHPESVFLIADQSMKPEVKRVKMDKRDIKYADVPKSVE